MPELFTSYAQNCEDVVLWRALGHIRAGRYVDVGANDPQHDSVTKAFYDRGWSGIDVEPVAEFADRLREQRPRDLVVQVAVTDLDVEEVTIHQLAGTGLSTLVDEVAAGHAGREYEPVRVEARTLADVVANSPLAGEEVHFLKVDVEGAEGQVLRSADFATWRPWVVVVEATAPLTQRHTYREWEDILLEQGYVFCLFDGLSRFYVSPHHPEVTQLLDHGACIFDEFVTTAQVSGRDDLVATRELASRLDAQLVRAQDDLAHWRTLALVGWGSERVEVPGAAAEVGALRAEVADLRSSTSWRATAPLRWVMTRMRARL